MAKLSVAGRADLPMVQDHEPQHRHHSAKRRYEQRLSAVITQRTDEAIAFDESNLILYVSIFQIFRIWLLPFYYAPVYLTSVIKLRRSDDNRKYYIESQDDLYAIDQWIRFIAPGGWVLVYLWQFWASLFCVIGTILLHPITLLEERASRGDGGEIEWQRKKKRVGQLDGMSAAEVLRRTELKGRIIG